MNKHVQKILPKLELSIMRALILWNLLCPCLRMRTFMNGHKQGMLGPGGILLVLSVVLNVFPYFVVMVILGSQSPFLIPVALTFNSALVLLVKLSIDKEYRKWNIEEQINHAICAPLFIVPSQTTRNLMVKDSVGEIMFYYVLNFLQWLAMIPFFHVFPELLEKVDKMHLPMATSVLVYIVLPVCILLSAVFRGLHYMKDAWAFGRQRSCATVKNSLR